MITVLVGWGNRINRKSVQWKVPLWTRNEWISDPDDCISDRRSVSCPSSPLVLIRFFNYTYFVAAHWYIGSNENENDSFCNFEECSRWRMLCICTTFSSFCLQVHGTTLAVLARAEWMSGISVLVGEFTAVTDGEINRSDNRARCTCRRKETNEQTHNRRRVIYTNHLDAIMTGRSGRSQNYLAKLVTSLVTWPSTRVITWNFFSLMLWRRIIPSRYVPFEIMP